MAQLSALTKLVLFKSKKKMNESMANNFMFHSKLSYLVIYIINFLGHLVAMDIIFIAKGCVGEFLEKSGRPPFLAAKQAKSTGISLTHSQTFGYINLNQPKTLI